MMANVVRRGRYAAEMPITATTTKTRKVRNNCAVMCLLQQKWPEECLARGACYENGGLHRAAGGRGPRLQTPKEVDHGGADPRRTSLLGPMTTARQHDRGPELGDQCRLLRDVLGENGGH